MLSMNDEEEHENNFRKHNPQLNTQISIMSLVMFYKFIKWL